MRRGVCDPDASKWLKKVFTAAKNAIVCTVQLVWFGVDGSSFAANSSLRNPKAVKV
jgi:hypothetical protein